MTAAVFGDGYNTCEVCSGPLSYEPMHTGHIQSRCYTCWDVRPVPRRTVQEFEASEPVRIGVVVQGVLDAIARNRTTTLNRKRGLSRRTKRECVECRRVFMTVRSDVCSEHCRVMRRRRRLPTERMRARILARLAAPIGAALPNGAA